MKIKSQLAFLSLTGRSWGFPSRPRLFAIGLSILAAGVSSCGAVPGTSMATVEPGFAGLKIQLYGGEKGIDNAQLVSGRVWYNGYTEDVVVFLPI